MQSTDSWNLEGNLKFLILVLTSILIVLLAASIGQFFTVSTIYVRGTTQIASEVDRLRGRNILLIDEKKLKQEILSGHKDLSDVSVGKIYPNTLEIKLEERKGVAQVEQGTHYFVIDQNGTAFKSATEKLNLPLLEGIFTPLTIGGSFAESETRHLFMLLKLLREEGIVIQTITLLDKTTAKLLLSPNSIIIIKTSIDPYYAVSSLQVMLRSFRIEGKFPRMIDLRYDKPVLSF